MRFIGYVAIVAATMLSALVHAQDRSPTVSVAIQSPGNGTVVQSGATIQLTATASVNRDNWPVIRVEYYDGTRLLGSAATPPYAVQWPNVSAGIYRITAKAIATNPGQGRQVTPTPNMPTWTGESAPIAIRVNAPPAVVITAPAGGLAGNAPATLTLGASASDVDGTVSRVEFYANAVLIGTSTQAPYTLTWSGAPAGSYAITAVATDNDGASVRSAPVNVRVNAPPTVAISVPGANSVIAAGGAVTIAAMAQDADGTVARVDFYQGGTRIGTASAAPYTFTWSAPPSGMYTLTTVATDNDGATTTSAAVAIRVNAVPQVAITAPAQNTVTNAPGSLTVSATASDPDGNVVKVEFYANGNVIGGATQAPYSMTWSNVPAGSYNLTAIATDNDGGSTTSAPVSMRVNGYPTVMLTSPTSSASFRAPATVTFTATAQDSDGTVSRVEFYAGTALVAMVTAAPYTYIWTNVAAGSYSLTARAVDDAGAGTVSAPVAITIASAEAQIYYIHTDHLNTPRMITDAQREVVWTWMNDDPFGANPANEDPRNTGSSFTCNLRFPGQYFDKETNLHYNYFRDYEPAIGRYIQSDPIGLAGGINTYAYVENNPLSSIDTFGLRGPGPQPAIPSIIRPSQSSFRNPMAQQSETNASIARCLRGLCGMPNVPNVPQSEPVCTWECPTNRNACSSGDPDPVQSLPTLFPPLPGCVYRCKPGPFIGVRQ